MKRNSSMTIKWDWGRVW